MDERRGSQHCDCATYWARDADAGMAALELPFLRQCAASFYTTNAIEALNAKLKASSESEAFSNRRSGDETDLSRLASGRRRVENATEGLEPRAKTQLAIMFEDRFLA